MHYSSSASLARVVVSPRCQGHGRSSHFNSTERQHAKDVAQVALQWVGGQCRRQGQRKLQKLPIDYRSECQHSMTAVRKLPDVQHHSHIMGLVLSSDTQHKQSSQDADSSLTNSQGIS